MYLIRSLTLFLLLTSASEATTSRDIRIFEGSQGSDFFDPSSKHFVIVITSYNNKQWYLNNITSACNQVYDNFEIIFTDDCSPDNTGSLVESYLEKNPPSCKVTLIKNRVRCGALQNIYRSVAHCEPHHIIVSLDGDDWFAHTEVLSTLNNVYADDNVWMTHGQLQMYPGNTICYWSKKMPADVVKNNSYRSHPNIPTHLRTFYAWLFRKIKLEDLLHEGSFYPVTWDMAFMIPMMEISGGKHAFIDKVLYIYNECNAISDFRANKALQRALDLKIRAEKPYQPIKISPLFFTKHTAPTTSAVDLFVTSEDNPFDLHEFLISAQEYVHGYRNMYVAWTAHSEKIAALYRSFQQDFPSINFIQCPSPESLHVTYVLFLRYLKKNNEYVLTCRDTIPFKEDIDLPAGIKAIEDTQAQGLYCIDALTTYSFKLVAINDKLKASPFLYTPEQWKSQNPCIAALCNSTVVLNDLAHDHINTKHLLPQDVPNHVGLFIEA